MALVEQDGQEGPRVVAEIGALVQGSHGAQLLSWLELLLARAGWSKSSLDGFVATRGPGSFTGIRVGLGTIRGLSLATGRPAVGVTTLEALAEAHGAAEAERLCLLEAGRGEVYGARYDARSSPPVELERPWLDARERIGAHLGPAGAVLVPGHGLDMTGTDLPRAVRIASTPRTVAGSAARLALLGWETLAPLAPLSPLYLRPPDALLKTTPG